MLPRIIAVFALMLTVPAMAQTPEQKAPTPVQPPKVKLICKTHAETGSLIARRKICRTAAEWRQESDDIQNMNNSRHCNGPSCQGIPG